MGRAIWIGGVGAILSVALAVHLASDRGREIGAAGAVPAGPPATPLQEALAAVQRAPESAEAWAALGDAQAALGQEASAEESYRAALRFGGKEPNLFARLGFLLYSRGQDAEAELLLAEAERAGADAPLLAETLATLRARDGGGSADSVRDAARRDADESPARPADDFDSGIADVLPPRDCSVKVSRRFARGAYTVAVAIDEVDSRLVVDTGASITVLGSGLVSRLGIAIDPKRSMAAVTAAGKANLPLVNIRSLRLGNRTARDLTVAVCTGCETGGAEGLLGLDVQAKLGLELDLKHERVKLPCD
jgi:tetratricopeptide (TPR) repeat protein